MKVLFTASEATPFFSSGGLGDVVGSLPVALNKKGVNTRVILPLYGDIPAQWREKLHYITNFTVPVGVRNQYCGLFELTHRNVIYYFLDNEYYFKRKGLYGFYDDGERYAFFSRAILETLQYIDFVPDVLHCNDWQCALVPTYLNIHYRHLSRYEKIKTVFTIHNIQYQGQYSLDIAEEVLGIPWKDINLVEYDGGVNLMKGAIESADRVTTVSPTYAQEILNPWYAFGLDRFLRDRAFKVSGIINGIDETTYNPETDEALVQNYNAKTFIEGKAACKKALQQAFALTECNAPLIGMVSRLVPAKGMDLVRHVADELLEKGFQLVLLGTGDREYETFFCELQERHPGMCGVKIGFIPALARKVYAGSDLFLMPSRSEPCGLAQMVALRYGTVPIVRQTGGLQDTITDAGNGKGNGFTFQSYNAHDMQNACMRAKATYLKADEWHALQKRGMLCNYTWDTSAGEYVKLYETVVTLW